MIEQKLTPTIGRTVIYTLNETDATAIETARAYQAAAVDTGARAIGNEARAGDTYPAVVVRVFDGNPHGVVNLQVLLDGSDAYWATSRKEGTEPGTWAWPERV